MIRAAIYLRYSSDLQDGATIETQRNECRRKAESLGAVVVSEYSDEAASARSEDRPSFQLMIAEAKAKPRPCDLIIVRKFSRFARDVMASRVYKSLLAKLGIKVVSAHEDVSDDASGQLFEGLIELMDEFYSANIANETKSGMETNTRRGFRNGGMPPYGYRNETIRDEATGKDRTRLAEDPIEAPVVRRVFLRNAEGAGLGQIAAELDAAGIRPRKAASWLKTSLHNMLRLETYRGVLLWRKTGKDESGWVRQVGGCPALIDGPTWEAVQARIGAKRAAGVGDKSDGSGHVLAGLVTCGHCGKRYVYDTAVGAETYFRCSGKMRRSGCGNSRSIPETWLVGEIKRALCDEMLTDDKILAAFTKLQLEAGDNAGERKKIIAGLEKQAEKIRGQIARLIDELSIGEISRSAISAKISELEKRLDATASSISEERAAIEREENLRVSRREVKIWGEAIRARILGADGAKLRGVLLGQGVRITASKAGIEVKTGTSLSTSSGIVNARRGLEYGLQSRSIK